MEAEDESVKVGYKMVQKSQHMIGHIIYKII